MEKSNLLNIEFKTLIRMFMNLEEEYKNSVRTSTKRQNY